MTRAALIERAFVEGNAASPVRVIAYEDLQCGDCAEYRRMLDEQLLPTFGQSVAFESRDFPLAKHPWARLAAIAARHFKHVHPELAAPAPASDAPAAPQDRQKHLEETIRNWFSMVERFAIVLTLRGSRQ